MQLRDFVVQVDGFNALPPRDKIRLFGWFLHTHKNQQEFDNAAIRGCFDELHIILPNVAQYLPHLATLKPPDLVKVKGGYKLERTIRETLDQKYGTHQTVVQVRKLLTDLIGKVPDLAERDFLDEAIKCYQVGAYRACIIMVWNVAYNHLLNWLLSDRTRLAAFNAAIGKRNSRKASLIMAKYDDFEDLKEREVIDICNIANLVNSSIYKVLEGKLDRRNTAAHPSNVVILQPQVDDMVADLVSNVVLALT